MHSRQNAYYQKGSISVVNFRKGEKVSQFGVPELLIILVIIILLFGVGRIGKIAGELGKGIKSFKDGLQGEKKDEPADENKTIEPK
jgi:sec-independent protein translocase protein TatA